MKLFPNFTRHHLIAHTNYIAFFGDARDISRLNSPDTKVKQANNKENGTNFMQMFISLALIQWNLD